MCVVNGSVCTDTVSVCVCVVNGSVCTDTVSVCVLSMEVCVLTL